MVWYGGQGGIGEVWYGGLAPMHVGWQVRVVDVQADRPSIIIALIIIIIPLDRELWREVASRC